jgi:HTH-type transcriptional regulator, sugar sensing transcriptional regulator
MVLAGLLKDIGLTEREVEVYLILMEIGSSPVNKIYERTGIQRRNIYDLLNKLVSKGLVSYIVDGNKKYFQPKDPEKLLHFIDEQKARLESKRGELAGNIGELKAKFNGIKTEQEAEIYRGLDGIKSILIDCLKEKEVLFIGATGMVEDKLPYFWSQYNRKRIANKTSWKLLLNYEAKDKPITKSLLYSYKILPKELSSPNVIYIYGNNVANVLWSDLPISFLIKDSRIADSYRKYFNFLWRSV